MSDDEFAAKQTAYWQYIHSVEARLPENVARLATQITLHDGRLRIVRVNRLQQKLALTLVIGDLQQGYRELQLDYADVIVDDELLQVLRRRVKAPKTEILSDEVALDGSILVHRILFWPEDEIEIRFLALEVLETSIVERGSRQIGTYEEERQ